MKLNYHHKYFFNFKDAIFDKFVTDGSFEETCVIRKRILAKNYYDFYIFFFWCILIGVPSNFYCTYLFINGTWLFKFGIITFIIIGEFNEDIIYLLKILTFFSFLEFNDTQKWAFPCLSKWVNHGPTSSRNKIDGPLHGKK